MRLTVVRRPAGRFRARKASHGYFAGSQAEYHHDDITMPWVRGSHNDDMGAGEALAKWLYVMKRQLGA